MSVRFVPSAGEFLLDQAAFDALISWVSTDEQAGSQLDEFRQAGVITPDGLHSDLASAVAAVVRPLCQLRLDVFDHDGTERSAEGWIDADTCALLADRKNGLRHFFEAHPTLIPAVVARLVGLRPRPKPVDSVEPLLMPRAVLEGLLGGSVAEREAAAARFASHGDDRHSVIDLLVAGPWRRWTVTTMWMTPSGKPASYGLQVVDTNEGMWRCEVYGVDASLWPTRSTEVWRALTRVLPSEVQEV